jgi:hypothetical protein
MLAVDGRLEDGSMSWMKRACRLGAMALLATAAVSACGDDSYIATNEIVDPDAASASGAAGAGGSAGQASGGSAGSAGCTPGDTLEVGSCEKCGISRRVCDASGEYGPPVCEEQGECEAGAEETAACGNCGSSKRTCGSSCTWGALGACSGEGACKPGAVDPNCMSGPAGKQQLDPCLQKECNNNCQWSTCKLRPGAVCAWEAGYNFKCCGTDMWQYCSGSGTNVCSWHPCASCNGCSAC